MYILADWRHRHNIVLHADHQIVLCARVACLTKKLGKKKKKNQIKTMNESVKIKLKSKLIRGVHHTIRFEIKLDFDTN